MLSTLVPLQMSVMPDVCEKVKVLRGRKETDGGSKFDARKLICVYIYMYMCVCGMCGVGVYAYVYGVCDLCACGVTYVCICVV